MTEYVALDSQNFYDIVLILYGNLEGTSDLLRLNEWLTPDYICKGGEIVLYEPSNVKSKPIVDYYKKNNITAINGSRSVYFKEPSIPETMIVKLNNDCKYIRVELSGYGIVEIDFGDNSPIYTVNLTEKAQVIDHYMDNTIGELRSVKFCLNGEIDVFSVFTDGLCMPLTIGSKIISKIKVQADKIPNLNFVSLINRSRTIDVSGASVSDIKGLIGAKYLNKIDINNCGIYRSVLDRYLIDLCKLYSNRVAAFLNISGNARPSGEYKQPEDLSDPKTGMEAIWVLVNDEFKKWTIKVTDGEIYIPA